MYFLDAQTKSTISPLIYFQKQKLSHVIIAAVFCDQINAFICVFYYVMSFEDKMMTLPIEVVSTFLKEDVINMCQTDIDRFKEKLLFLENVDYIYSSKNIIPAMERH